MNCDWEYKQLGEVCTIYQPKTLSTDMLVDDGKYLVYGANGVIGRYNQYNHTEKELLITCRGATCGALNISEPYSWINGNAMVAHIKVENLMFKYLYFALKSLDWSLIITGAAQPQITRQKLAPTCIPIPPLPVQEQIVSELDTIYAIIDKKKAQLQELDNIAQSIFYQMFGDPITNEKGWEVRKLSECAVGKLSYGSGASAIPFDGQLRYVRITDIVAEGILSGDAVSPSTYEDKYLLNEGDVLFARSGATVGKTYCYHETDGKCIYAGYLIRLVPNQQIVMPSYVFHFTKSHYYLHFVEQAQRAVAQPNINAQQYGDLQITIPPLTLQQEFAKKVEAIEAQKETTKASIKEVEALLAQTMDKYFG